MSLQQNETDFTIILNGYSECNEQQKQWKATCAALELLKHTLSFNTANEISGFTRYERVKDVALSIRNSLEHASE